MTAYRHVDGSLRCLRRLSCQLISLLFSSYETNALVPYFTNLSIINPLSIFLETNNVYIVKIMCASDKHRLFSNK